MQKRGRNRGRQEIKKTDKKIVKHNSGGDSRKEEEVEKKEKKRCKSMNREMADSFHSIITILPGDLRSKLEEGVSVRDPQEEGLYVGEKPFLTPANRNIVENRLLRQNNR